jgi:hypothetical protein
LLIAGVLKEPLMFISPNEIYVNVKIEFLALKKKKIRRFL